MNKTKKSKASPTLPSNGPLETILKRLNSGHWDYVLVGDGSGSTWAGPAAWAAVSIEHATGNRLVWTGSANRGTNNFGEIMAYLHALTGLVAREEARRDAGSEYRAVHVHIITDSEYCKFTGSGRTPPRSKNRGLWSCFDAFKRSGFVLTWHHLKRDTILLNHFCDVVAGTARARAEEEHNIAVSVGIVKSGCVDLCEMNPLGGGS